MRIAIFGGSFNPPHSGHVRAAEAARRGLAADKLLVIPSAVPPHKQQPQDSPATEQRLELVKLAFDSLADVQVCDIELRRGGKSYTVDTLTQLRAEYPQEEFALLMGTDMLLCFDTAWKDFQKILEYATLAVFPRQKGQDTQIKDKCLELASKYGARIEILDFVPTEISSSELRELLRERKGTQFFPEAVYGEIIRHRYYGAKPDLDWLRTQAMQYVDEKRRPHVLGCEQEARALARRWGVDEDLAAEAAILHDITKAKKGEAQLKLCDMYGIITDDVEKENYKLLHSKTGAEFSQREFGIDSEVYGAIRWHTTGKAEMSLLEKLIYIADYIEPNRDFEGLSELRALAYEDLDAAMRLGLEMSARELKEKDKKPHINTINALEYYSGAGRNQG